MYSDKFSKPVKLAFEKSRLNSNKEIITSNPYYVGFGNPNSRILIIGQEKAIGIENKMQIMLEFLNIHLCRPSFTINQQIKIFVQC